MIRKLTIKTWLGNFLLILFCWGMSIFMLLKYGPSAVEALKGGVPPLAARESMTNIYGISALGLFFAVLGLLILAVQLRNSVGKRVRKYLSEHPGITMEQLENDFSGATQVGNVWVGRKWTFSHDMRCILVGNAQIALVYSETEHSRNNINYYLCLGLADGKVERIKVSSQKKLAQIQETYESFAHILVGNNPEYGYLFRNNLNEFLEMKYRENKELVQPKPAQL